MAGHERTEQARDDAAADDTTDSPESEDSALTRLRILAEAAAGTVRDLGRLFAVDAKLCISSVLAMVALGVVAWLLLLTVWLFGNAAAALFLLRFDVFSLATAVLAVAGLNLLLMLGIGLKIRSISRDLNFRRSREAVSSIRANVTTPREEACSPAGD